MLLGSPHPCYSSFCYFACSYLLIGATSTASLFPLFISSSLLFIFLYGIISRCHPFCYGSAFSAQPSSSFYFSTSSFIFFSSPFSGAQPFNPYPSLALISS